MIRYIVNKFRTEEDLLAYSLKSAEHALIFKVDYQSDIITRFLKKNGYRAKNGLLITANKYPEFKDSENTIFLQGSDTSRNGKIDTTRFVGNMQRDKKKAMIQEALAEFVDFVKQSIKAQEAIYVASYSKPTPPMYFTPCPLSGYHQLAALYPNVVFIR